ncbi:MAG: hypothetical protein NVS2B9_11140 [Myxococcales bacterium]
MLAAAAALVFGGCGLAPSGAGDGGVTVAVTRDFGERELASAHAPAVRSSDTVIGLLEARHRVTRARGGQFVQSIDGLGGDRAARRGWSIYVNGTEGLAGDALSGGDVVQGDYHRSDATLHVPAIVGAYPEPFVHGRRGKRFPVRVECENDGSPACALVRANLIRDGASPTGAQLGSISGSNTIRVVVARWQVARRVGTVSALAKGPAKSGVYARFDYSGTRLYLLDAEGRAKLVAPSGTGLVAATAQPGGAIEWVVTGLDDSGVNRAAAALSRSGLHDAFAVALTPGAELRLPVR